MSTTSVSSTSSAANSGYGVAPAYSGVSSSTSSPVNSSTIESALGITSTIDTATLAQNLVNAVEQPQQAIINGEITTQQNKIAGYNAISSALTQLTNAFTALDSNTNYQNYSATESNSAIVSVTAATSAQAGNHQLSVNQLAQAQTSESSIGFTDPSESLNGGTGFSFNVTVGGTTTSVSVASGNDTPQGIADAINKANLGVTANVANTGQGSDPYSLVLQGGTGSANTFSLGTIPTNLTGSSSATSLAFNTIQPAKNANFVLDGISYTNSSNTVSGALLGATLQLSSVGSSSVNLAINTSTVASDFTTLVSAYNSLQSVISAASSASSTVAGYGASLVSDPTVSMIQQQVLGLFEATPGSGLPSLMDLGITVQSNGTMALDSTTLNSELSSNYSNVIQAMNANTAGIDGLLPTPGIAGAAVNQLKQLTSTSGLLASQVTNANSAVTGYQTNLTNLQTQMQNLLSQYTQQFAAMSSMLAETASLKAELTAQFNPPSSSSG